MQFIDRKRELEMLNRFYVAPGAGLMVLYGRRRVGKTRLLVHYSDTFSRQADGFYWTASLHNWPVQLRDFSQTLLRYDRPGVPPPSDYSFPNWESALTYLGETVAQRAEPQLIVIDEFTYLLRSDPGLASVLQKVWDHHLSRQPKLKLVLTGSLVGAMERDVISHKAPLYGRATALYKLRPLPYAAFVELFPGRTPAERVAIYAVTGGVPAYLELFTRSNDFVTALREQCLVPGSIMMSDSSLILHEQLREPQVYESVMWAIASGFRKWSDIARMAGVSETGLGHYLGVLQSLDLIERRDPVLRRRGRQGLYHVRDDFLRFYYRFIAPNISAIEQGYLDSTARKINQELRAFIGGHTFEQLCREWVWAASATGELAFQPDVVGSYWTRQRGQSVQLDVVAADQKKRHLLIGEAKWGQGPIGRQVLTNLVERSQRMQQVTEGWGVTYILFAREGFSSATQKLADELGAILVPLAEMERTLITAHE